MKILLTADPEIPVPPVNYGGIERIVDILVQGLVSAGHDVTLCANPESEVPCRLIGWKGLRSQNKLDTIQNLLTLTQLVKKEKFDIVHSFSRLAYMGFIMPFSVKKIMSYQREPSLRQVSKAVKLSKKNTLVFTGCSDYISKQLAGTAESYTIYNCAPVEKYDLNMHPAENAPLVFLGRIEPVKGTHNAVTIAMKAGRKLIIAGNIPPEHQGYFDEKIKPFLNEQISYIGPVNDAQKNTLLGNAAALLMPIEWNEPFGIVMAEAFACGTPVIGYPKGAVKEVVENGITGFLCNTVDEAVAKVSALADLNRSKIREIADKKFSSKKIVADYIGLYNNMLHRK